MTNVPLITPLRLLIVADDAIARTGLATLLTERSDFAVPGQVSSADLVQSIGVYSPNVIVWDMGWTPAAAVEQLADMGDLGVPVLALLVDDTYAVDTWTAGAKGLFLRSTRIESLIAGIPGAAAGLITIDPALGKALLSPRERAIPTPSEDLTSRELQVLQYLAQGLANKVIAQQLGISESTVKFHVNAIMGKLNAQSRTDAVVRATRLGLIIL